MRSSRPPAFALALLLAVQACGGSASTASPASSPDMYAHYGHIAQIQSAVVTGRLEAIRQPAIWLAERDELEDLPAGLRPYHRGMRMLSLQVAETPSVEAAAYAVAEMARTCGACHAAGRAGPSFAPGSRPPEATGVRSHMRRHIWAADRMWEGLIGPSQASWQAGAAALVEAPLQPEWLIDEEARGGEAQRLRAMSDEVHTLGVEAATTSDPHERADLYGAFLATCAGCHTAVNAFGG